MEKYRDKILANVDKLVHNVEKEMMDAFEKVDKNGDGKITKVEVEAEVSKPSSYITDHGILGP
jgi:Ca2+-binding EF-hand superfamily protein